MIEEEAGTQAPADIVVLGKVVDSYGLRGALKVHPFADDPAAWGAMSHWWLGREGDAPDTWCRLRLIRCREQSGLLIATLEGVVDRDASESLRGMLVGAPREALPSTADDEYYWGDMIGLEVVNVAQQSLGQVLGLLETPANAVLRIGDGEGGERLLLFVDSVVLKVDLPAQRIEVDWGLDW